LKEAGLRQGRRRFIALATERFVGQVLNDTIEVVLQSLREDRLFWKGEPG